MDSWNDQSLLDVHFTRTPLWRVQSIWLRIRCWFVQNKLNPGMLCRHLESKCALHPKAEHFCNDFSYQQTIYGSLWSGFLRSSSQFLRPVGFPLESSACRKRSAYASSKCRSWNRVCCCFLGGSGGERTNKCSWEHVVMWLYGTATAINIQ